MDDELNVSGATKSLRKRGSHLGCLRKIKNSKAEGAGLLSESLSQAIDGTQHNELED